MTMTLGALLKSARKHVGLTQREVARRVGVSFTYISKIEHDALDFPPSDALLRRMAALYGIEDQDAVFIAAGKCPPDLLHVMSTNLPFVNAVRALLPSPADLPS